MITPRQEKILKYLIKSYIKKAEAVSSKLLETKYDLGISAPMIRLELQKLAQEGYIYEPYHSGGKAPTDKGYRFFVEKILKNEKYLKEKPKKKINLKVKKFLVQKEESSFKKINELLKFLSQETSSLAVLDSFDDNFIFKEGWQEILKEPEFKTGDFGKEFSEFLENFLKNWLNDFKKISDIKVFIGRESQIKRGEKFSILVSPCRIFKEKKGILSLVGPKRMDYDKSIELLSLFQEIF